MSPAALRGLVLEEALAQLLVDSGYLLLVEAAQDPDALERGRHGLLVKGRGANHQADALGELLTPTPFGLPVRLFVEAKFRDRPTGLQEARNAHGVIHDVNEHFATSGRRRSPLRRHDYRYALFSTSGFTRPAQEYALAQQISLVDLSGPAFQRLRRQVHSTATALRRLAVQEGLSTFPTGLVRTALRLALGTWSAPTGPLRDDDSYAGAVRRARLASTLTQARPSAEPALPAEALAARAADLAVDLEQSLLLGFPPAPFILALRPDDLAAFDAYVETHGTEIPVDVVFARRGQVAGDWVIVPTGVPGAFRLRFGLPGALEAWLLAEDGIASSRVREAKAGLLASITVFRRGAVVRLGFTPTPDVRGTQPSTVAVSQLDPTVLRRRREAPQYALGDESEAEVELAFGDIQGPTSGLARWTLEGLRELLRRLDLERREQAQVVRVAARSGGSISRDAVYDLAGYDQERTLRGFTRPTNRITRQLVDEGLLPAGVPPALTTIYPPGQVKASEFLVPPDFVDLLQP